MKIVGIFLVLYIFCGIRSIECIYGGRNATLGEFPYMVSIREKIGGHYCGGAILNKRYIVTSGACLEFYRNPNELIATAGITSLEEEGTTMDIGKMIKHPHFNMDTLAHDIALLRTAKDIKFGKRITAIGLPTSDLPARGGTTVTVAGWGDTVVVFEFVALNLTFNANISFRLEKPDQLTLTNRSFGPTAATKRDF